MTGQNASGTILAYQSDMTGCVLLDLGGVVYEGDQPLRGALAALERLRGSGVPVRFVTNTTRTAKGALLRRLVAMGVKASAAELFTPADAALRWLAERGLAPELLVHPNLVAEFDGVAGAEGKALVVGDAGEAFTYEALNRAFRLLMDGAAFVALARNRMFRDGEGRLNLDAGPFVAALEFASGREAVILGKPSPDFFEAASSSAGCRREEAVMVGDDAESDVAGALAAGVGEAILVRTGKYLRGAEHGVHPPPTAVADDLAAAVDIILAKTA